MCDTPCHGSDHLWLIWKESIQNCRCYRADTAAGTDGRTDGRTEWNQYTPQQLRCSGGIIRSTLTRCQSLVITPVATFVRCIGRHSPELPRAPRYTKKYWSVWSFVFRTLWLSSLNGACYYSGNKSEWVIKFDGPFQLSDTEVHVIHISCVIITYTLESQSPHTQITQNLHLQVAIYFRKKMKAQLLY